MRYVRGSYVLQSGYTSFGP